MVTKMNRESIINLLMAAQESDRMVVEFKKREGELIAFDITDHVDTLEERVSST